MERYFYIAASLLMTSCANADFEDMLESPVAVTGEGSSRHTDMSEEAEFPENTVYFFNSKDMAIVARAQWDGKEEKWLFRETVSEKDKIGMADVAHQLFLSPDWELGTLRGSYICGKSTLQLYRFRNFHTVCPEYRVIAVRGDRKNK